MSDHSKIEWTEASWNPITGCTKASAGCKHCYAERQWPRFHGREWVDVPVTGSVAINNGIDTVNIPRLFTHVMCHEDRLTRPLRWKRPRRIFVNSVSDLFHEDVPDEFIDRVFAVMALAGQHIFQVLTKRPERMLHYMSRLERSARLLETAARSVGYTLEFNGQCLVNWPLPNVWLGVSVENQETADERIPLLLKTSAAVRWVSAEPLLGPVDLTRVAFPTGVMENVLDCRVSEFAQRAGIKKLNGVDWVVVGGESGPMARPMNPEWVYSLRDQCNEVNVPFFFKQWGEWVTAGHPAFGTIKGIVQHIRSDGSFWGSDLPQDENADVITVVRVGKRIAGRLLGGVLHDEYPAGGRHA